MINQLNPTDKAQSIAAGAMLTIMLAVALGSVWPQAPQTHAAPLLANAPIIIIVTATPALPTAVPPTPVPTDAPAPVVQVEPPTPVIIEAPAPLEVAPIVAPPDPPTTEAHEVAPGVEHGISPAPPRPHDIGTNGGMPAARPQP